MKKVKHRHKVLVKNPEVSSYAALILLKRKYYDIVEPSYLVWLKFRMQLLTKWQKEKGDLFCEYCNKGPLIKEENNQHPYVATLDHKVSRANGGAEYDEGNLCVSCYECNQKKKDLNYEEFKKASVA